MPRPPALSTELMNTFVLIVRTEGDAIRAAEILKINQPSMSKRLAFLQHSGKVLRRPWLQRVGKTWQLTAEGRRIYPAVEELVHRYNLLRDAIDEERPGVIFGCGPGSATGFVRDAVRLYRSKNADATFRITCRPSNVRAEGVGNGSLDLACVRLPDQDIHDLARRSLHIEELGNDPLMLVTAAKGTDYEEFHSSAEKIISPKSLTRFPLILPESETGLRREFDRRCHDAGIQDRIKVAAEVGPWRTALEYVRDGIGVALVPRSVSREPDLLSKALPPRLTPENAVKAICRRKAGSDDLDLSELGMSFLESLRQSAKVFAEE